MESDKTTQITDEVIRLMNLQVEVLKGTLVEMTVSQVHEYAERRDRIGQLCLDLPTVSARRIFIRAPSAYFQDQAQPDSALRPFERT